MEEKGRDKKEAMREKERERGIKKQWERKRDSYKQAGKDLQNHFTLLWHDQIQEPLLVPQVPLSSKINR